MALRFLEDARAYGLGILGFTGGEPFLYPQLLHNLCRRAAQLGYGFDKIMTNGVRPTDPCHADAVLGELAAVGFSGKLGLGVDKFHGNHTAALADLCRVARRVFGRDTILSISDASLEPLLLLLVRADALPGGGSGRRRGTAGWLDGGAAERGGGTAPARRAGAGMDRRGARGIIQNVERSASP